MAAGTPRRDAPASVSEPKEHLMAVIESRNQMARTQAASTPRDQIVRRLTDAYLMEIETVMNYLAASTNLDGILGRQVADLLAGDIAEELQHAERLAQRIRERGGAVPGSDAFAAQQTSLQPPASSTDAPAVIRGVIDAERAAIAAYSELARLADGNDYVTHDLAVSVLADEEGHRRLFEGLLD
jgi:bacterioferritin